MWDITDESGLAFFASDHFSPLIPFEWLSVVEEIVEQFMCALTPSQTYERANGAQFVGCVIVPASPPVSTVREFLPVALKRPQQQILGQVALLVPGRQRNGG